jgi:transposase
MGRAVPVTSSTVVVAIDVGKNEFAFSVTDATRKVLCKPQLGRAMTAPAVRKMLGEIGQVLPANVAVKIGIEAAGHYHRPLLDWALWPAEWALLELNPGQVAEQRKVLGKRTIKTDAIDLRAMTELVLAGQGNPRAGVRQLVFGELKAWSAHRISRVEIRTALKTQLLGQLDRSFPGLTMALSDVLGTKVGRLVAAEFADPARLAAFGAARFITFGAARGVQIRKPTADKLIAAARDALTTRDAAVARTVLAADLVLLADLDAQIESATAELCRLLPDSPFSPLLTVPGWGAARVAGYGGALGDPARFTQPPADLPQRWAEPDPIRIRRETPRQRHQPGRQRRTPTCPDRPGHGLVAVRSGCERLRRRAEGPREEGRRRRLRDGAPGEPDRLGPRP